MNPDDPRIPRRPYYVDDQLTLHHGDALDVLTQLPDGSVDCCVTSPPYYGLRDYGEPGQYGLEPSPAAYVAGLDAAIEAAISAIRTETPAAYRARGISWTTVARTSVRAAAPHIRRAALLEAADELAALAKEPDVPATHSMAYAHAAHRLRARAEREQS